MRAKVYSFSAPRRHVPLNTPRRLRFLWISLLRTDLVKSDLLSAVAVVARSLIYGPYLCRDYCTSSTDSSLARERRFPALRFKAWQPSHVTDCTPVYCSIQTGQVLFTVHCIDIVRYDNEDTQRTVQCQRLFVSGSQRTICNSVCSKNEIRFLRRKASFASHDGCLGD